MNEFTVRLDLAKGRARQQQTVFVRQGDKNATTIVATITDHGAAAATSGLTARFSMRLPDGTHYYRKAATLSGNVATVALDEAQAASVAGRTDVAYFQLLQGSTIVASTESFTVVVLPDALAGATVTESYDSAIQDAIDALDAAVEQMPDMVEDVLADHPEWTTTVQDGSITEAKLATDLARDRERLLYRLDNLLTNALPEGETATATDAAKTPLAGLALYGRSTQDGTPTPSAPVPIVSVTPDSEGNISLLARGFNQWDEEVEAGGINTGTGKNTATAGYNRSKSYISVLPSTEYYIKAPTTMALLFYDADGAFIAGSASYRANTTFTTPANAHYMRFRNDTADAWPTYNHDICINLSDPARNGEYQPYTETVTPVPLGGHELRSLPDGTRDELTVGARGHAVLVQRVGSVTLNGSAYASSYSGATYFDAYTSIYGATRSGTVASGVLLCDKLTDASGATVRVVWLGNDGRLAARFSSASGISTAAQARTWLDTNTPTVLYPLATPVTIDLGTIDPVPLVGPDMTAQAVPTAPFALTYERDLNATLARLEAAIADAATS